MWMIQVLPPTRGSTDRESTDLPGNITNAMIARPVRPAELKGNKNAQAKMQEEIDKLVKRDVWDLSGVRSWKDVASEARAKGHKAQRGNVFGICVEKGS